MFLKMKNTIQELAKYANDLRVLFVEDDDGVRAEVSNLLAGFFNIVDNAANGQEGLEKYKYNNSPFSKGGLRGIYYDIVISDIKMPVMDGMEMVKKIKEIDKEQSVIMISAHDESEYLMELINVNIDKFILKPIENQRFLDALLQVCKAIVNEKKLFQYKSNLEAIFKSIKDAIITVDSESRVVELNKAAEEICGFPGNNEALGKEFNSFLSGCSGKCLDALNETIKTKLPAERSRFECNSKKDSRQVASVVTYPLFDLREKFNGCIIVIRDETKLVDLEIDLHKREKFQNIIGTSDKMQRIYSLIEALSNAQTTVLITGENGTGKGMVAEALHYHKNTGKSPFVVINCAALSDNLLESELFGHVRGAYTGAVSDRVGRFQKADGGTIFLDEIGDISNTMQLRLLRVLQEMEFERVGDSTPIKVNVRIIAATNQDLHKKVRSGQFREDLYHRLKVVELNMPPLRDRIEDVPLLVEQFIENLNKKFNKNIKFLSDDVQKIFMGYKWPGNVRELQHTLEYAFVLCSKAIITIDNLAPDFEGIDKRQDYSQKKVTGNERRTIVEALKQTDWNKAKAARLLGISRMTIYLKMKKYEIIEGRQG